MKKKNIKLNFVSLLIGVILLIIIVYVIISSKSDTLSCERNREDNYGVKYNELINLKIQNRRIIMVDAMTIIYLDNSDEAFLKSIKYLINKNNKDKNTKVNIGDKSIIIDEKSTKNEVKFGYISFTKNEDDKLSVYFSNEYDISIKEGDNYSKGEVESRLKNNGFECK